MGIEQVFEEWCIYAQKKELKEREADLARLEANSKLKIVAVTGIRRSGKSSLLHLLYQRLKKEDKPVGYIHIEDSRIRNEKNVLDEILKWFGDSGYLLLDEITYANDWEGWLARNHEMLKGKLHLIVSSSRGKLITPIKPLRGRMLPFELYPLSFNEFLKFSSIPVEKTTAGIGKVERALNDYLKYGGFPEVVLEENKTEKINLLNSYFKDILGLDVAEVSGENVTTVELFGKYIIDAPYFSASQCLKFFKSVGYKIGKQSILYLEKFSQEAYLFHFVPIFSYTIKDRSQYPRKAYIGDTGFMYAISGRTDLGRLFENSVFIELKRRLPKNQEINYWKNKAGREADFVIREGLKAKQIIQVVYGIEENKTKEREIQGLVECAKENNLKEGLIINKDISKIETVEGIKIRYVSLWEWLLETK